MNLYDMPIYEVFWRTRRLFQRLGTEFQPVPGGDPLTGAQRAVLEFLDRGGPQTVPDIARQRSVSRQHIQVGVNALAEAGWVEDRTNPAHRRSPLIAITDRGRERLRAAQAVEAQIAAAIEQHFATDELVAAAAVLGELETFFDSQAWRDIRQEFIDKGESQ